MYIGKLTIYRKQFKNTQTSITIQAELTLTDITAHNWTPRIWKTKTSYRLLPISLFL